MFTMEEILKAQADALDTYAESPYYTLDDVKMYRSVFGMMNTRLQFDMKPNPLDKWEVV